MLTGDKERGCWISYIRKDGRTCYIGRFKDEEVAARAYDGRALELFGEFALINFPVGSNGNA